MQILKMKVKELQHELKHWLVPFGGVKEKLVERLLQAMVEEKPKYTEAEIEVLNTINKRKR